MEVTDYRKFDRWIETSTGNAWYLMSEDEYCCVIQKKQEAGKGFLKCRLNKKCFISNFAPAGALYKL